MLHKNAWTSLMETTLRIMHVTQLEVQAGLQAANPTAHGGEIYDRPRAAEIVEPVKCDCGSFWCTTRFPMDIRFWLQGGQRLCKIHLPSEQAARDKEVSADDLRL